MTVDMNSPRNWTEDSSHENGNYECRCINCQNSFIGHKRRVVCKLCIGLEPLLTNQHKADITDLIKKDLERFIRDQAHSFGLHELKEEECQEIVGRYMQSGIITDAGTLSLSRLSEVVKEIGEWHVSGRPVPERS